MEVQISPAPIFNGNNQNMIRASSQSQSYEPSSKRFKSDLTYQCIVCSDVYDDPNILYEHMKKKHQELYEREDGSSGENGFDSDSEHELSDEEYLDLSRLLEPICELRQDDDDEDDDENYKEIHDLTANQPANIIAQLMQNGALGIPMNEEQLHLQLQLQMQLQSHLLQMQQMNGELTQRGSNQNDRKQKESQRSAAKTTLSLRKLGISLEVKVR